jgi:hypothetical protein
MPQKTAAVAAASKSETVHEFVLYRRVGDDSVPIMSDPDLDLVKAAKINAVNEDVRAGRARPDLYITDRECTYPLRNGKRQAEGSICDESEV